MFLWYKIFILMAVSTVVQNFEHFLSYESGEARKEKFTYHKMTYEGTILLELVSVTGDCDLYVSQHTLQPTYDPELNCLQSVTCGLDTIIVPKSFKRPIGIGIFGHPSHELSTYHLLYYRVNDSQDIFYYDPYSESNQAHSKKKKNSVDVESDSYEEFQLPQWVLFIWNFLLKNSYSIEDLLNLLL